MSYFAAHNTITAQNKVLKRNYILANLIRNRALYLMALPGIIYYIVFKYIPLAGIVIAFQDYNIFKGITGSNFVGLKNFFALFGYGDFLLILKNNILIGLYDIIFGFPAPILLAILLNEIKNARFKGTVQSIVYLPHFLSWTVLGGIVTTQFLSMETGIINHILTLFDYKPVYFLAEPGFARPILIISGIWKEVGWGTVIYLAAISGINLNLYEAANIDGAGRLRQLFYITLPSIMNVMVVLFLLRIGHFLDFGFERVWVFLNGANREKIDIFDTFVYQSGIRQGLFSYATAVGLFKSLVGLIMLGGCNKISKKISGEGLF